jgi:hypothetical protein
MRSTGRLEVWHDGGAWRWLYREPQEDLVLLGNRSRPTRAAAVAAGRASYPGVPLHRRNRNGGGAVHALAAMAIGGLGTLAVLTVRRRLPLRS